MASFAVFGRRARRSACHSAIDALYSSRQVQVDALRRSSTEINEGTPIEPPGDLTHTETLRPEDRDVFTLGERQIAADTHGGRQGFTPPA